MSLNQWLRFGTEIVLLIGAVGLLIPCLVLLLECMAALWPKRQDSEPSQSTQPLQTDVRTAVLVPAHNEASGIRATLEPLLQQLTPSDSLLVVADNCSDDTAAIARSTGATVIERHNLEQVGKGFALDYGLQFMAANPPDIVVLVDADCEVHLGAIAQISQQAIATGKPVQATYLMEKPTHPTPKDAVSAFAFKVKNLVRPSGLAHLGLPCLLTGTGMAFPWSVIRSVDLASGHLVEDMKLGLDLAIAGYSPHFCPSANVIGRLPQQQQAAQSQRTRWEHGHLQTLLTYVPRLLLAALRQRRVDLFMLALDLLVPPLSLLVVFWVGLTLVAGVAGMIGVSWLPALILVGAGLCLLSAILAAWAKFGRADLPALTLLSIPFYILWKIPLYFKFLVRPQAKWVRTERDAVEASD